MTLRSARFEEQAPISSVSDRPAWLGGWNKKKATKKSVATDATAATRTWTSLSGRWPGHCCPAPHRAKRRLLRPPAFSQVLSGPAA